MRNILRSTADIVYSRTLEKTKTVKSKNLNPSYFVEVVLVEFIKYFLKSIKVSLDLEERSSQCRRKPFTTFQFKFLKLDHDVLKYMPLKANTCFMKGIAVKMCSRSWITRWCHHYLSCFQSCRFGGSSKHNVDVISKKWLQISLWFRKIPMCVLR